MRKRAAGVGARHRLVFVDRLVATLIHLRHDPPHAVEAWPGVPLRQADDLARARDQATSHSSTCRQA